MTSIALRCFECAHFIGERSCKAFERIPDDIYFGDVLHDKPFPGDHGLRFQLPIGNAIQNEMTHIGTATSGRYPKGSGLHPRGEARPRRTTTKIERLRRDRDGNVLDKTKEARVREQLAALQKEVAEKFPDKDYLNKDMADLNSPDKYGMKYDVLVNRDENGEIDSVMVGTGSFYTVFLGSDDPSCLPPVLEAIEEKGKERLVYGHQVDAFFQSEDMNPAIEQGLEEAGFHRYSDPAPGSEMWVNENLDASGRIDELAGRPIQTLADRPPDVDVEPLPEEEVSNYEAAISHLPEDEQDDARYDLTQIWKGSFSGTDNLKEFITAGGDLRNLSPEDMDPKSIAQTVLASDRQAQILRNMDNLVANSYLPVDQQLYRGVERAEAEKLMAGVEPGAILELDHLTSWSTREDCANYYAHSGISDQQGPKVIHEFEVKASRGDHALFMGEEVIATEPETVLPRNTKFLYLGSTSQKDTTPGWKDDITLITHHLQKVD